MSAINSKYFQKSSCFLYPLTGLSYNSDVITYLDYINDYKLLIDASNVTDEYFKTIIKICEEEIEPNLLLVDLSEWKLDIDLFLEGKYSKFSEKAKKTILSYWKFSNIPKEPLDKFTAHVGLYPQYYYDVYSKELGIIITKGELINLFSVEHEIKKT